MFLNVLLCGFLKVDGIRNPKIQSIYLESFPIYKARFSVDGEQVIATGTHHRMFFVYDMMSGSIVPIQKVRGRLCSAPRAWLWLKLSLVQMAAECALEGGALDCWSLGF